MKEQRHRSSSSLICFAGFRVFLVLLSLTSLRIVLPSSAQEQQERRTAEAGYSESQRATSPSRDASLRLGSGDLIEVHVYNVPDLTTKARVTSDGNIYMPLIEAVHVKGLTVEEAQLLLEKQLADGGFVKEPHVSIFVDQYASDGASVLGEVFKPSIYPVMGEQHLLDLISAAGGLTERAGQDVTITHRSQPEKPVTVALGQKISANGESNVPVFPGDTIIVHRAEVVYVVGDVGRPSGFSMGSGHLTVLQAIALAGGTTRTAKLGAARIIRKTPAGMTETPVQLKKILEAKAPDLPMQPDDILFIPTSAGRILAGRTLEAAVQAASAASIVAAFP
jgi:polysaccharide biosynthesis/export protein